MRARSRRAMTENDEGFSLIEILVVIVILGILAGIAIPVFLNQRKKGYDASIKSDLRNAASAEEAYRTDYGAYTSTMADLTSTGWKQSTASNYSGAVTTFTKTGFYDSASAYTTGVASATAMGGYCLSFTSASGTVWSYDSTKGGVQASGVNCA